MSQDQYVYEYATCDLGYLKNMNGTLHTPYNQAWTFPLYQNVYCVYSCPIEY